MKNTFILSLVKWLLGFLNMDKNPNTTAMVGDIITANLSKKAIIIPIKYRNYLKHVLALYVKEQIILWSRSKTYETQEKYEQRINEAATVANYLDTIQLEIELSQKIATTDVTVKGFPGIEDGDIFTTVHEYWGTNNFAQDSNSVPVFTIVTPIDYWGISISLKTIENEPTTRSEERHTP